MPYLVLEDEWVQTHDIIFQNQMEYFKTRDQAINHILMDMVRILNNLTWLMTMMFTWEQQH
jgi:hypothetical protein